MNHYSKRIMKWGVKISEIIRPFELPSLQLRFEVVREGARYNLQHVIWSVDDSI